MEKTTSDKKSIGEKYGDKKVTKKNNPNNILNHKSKICSKFIH